MSRLTALNPDTVSGKTKELFEAITGKLGMVPNMMRTMGNSPAVLEAYLSFSGALGGSSIGGKLAELIALTVANANECKYCNAAHSFIGEKMAGLDANAIKLAREGRSEDAKIQAALSFARVLIQTKGRVSGSDVAILRNAGYNEAAVAEIIAHVGLNIFTNYFNNTSEVAVDFPEVETAAVAAI